MSDEREEPEWIPERREVFPELEADYIHAVYPPAATRWPTIADRINDADRETLRLWAAGGTGEPHGQ